jgi:SpoVK/Ycf46/Vps4 family AAA+-type ATPase
MSKWIGDGEKMVRALFAVASVKQPAVIFVDEIDSLLSTRGDGENDGVRRVKTEFLVQMDGVATDSKDRVLLIGATNRPDELDEAARRRLEKRLYIPLPDPEARKELIRTLLGKGNFSHEITEADVDAVAGLTDGYSGADLRNVCREAAMGPLRQNKSLIDVDAADIRPVVLRDFHAALRRIKPSVGKDEIKRYTEWNALFGSFGSDDVDDGLQ